METGRNRFPWNVTNLSFSWHKVILVCFVAILSYGAAKLGGTLIIGPQAEWPLWLGNAFLVSILLLVPRRMWPILIAAGFSASVLYNVQTGLTVRLSALLVLSDTVEVLAAALCLSYAFGGVPRLNNVRALAKFSLFGVILPPFIGAFCVALAANRNYWMSWRVYFFSEAIVYLTLVPAILGWFSKGSARRQKSRSYYLEAAALIAGLVAFGYVTFDAPWRYRSQALLYSLVPFMLWSALRFGTTGVSASTIVIAVLALWGAAHGRGPFIESQLLNNVLSLQLFLFFTAAPFMVLAAVVEENRQASEQKLRASEERLAETTRLYGELQNREAKIRRLVEANVVGIAMWNLEGAFTGANEAFLRMLQYGHEDLVSGRVRWMDLTPPEWRGRDEEAIADLIKTGIALPYEKEYFRKDGSRVPVLVGAAMFEGSRNEGVAFGLDLSEQKRAEAEIRALTDQLYRENRVTTMGELAASLAHEIKKPISAAMTDARTCSRWLTRDRPDLAEAQTAASRVVKDVARASEIIGRVRSLFKKDSLQHEEVDINELIQEMIALLRGEASRHSILIHSDCSVELPPIVADRVQLQQVLMNLMLNGIEAMKDMNTPGKLTIRSQRDDSGQLLISVVHTGVGVPPEKIEEIFNAFFTSKPQGTGMGLAISRSIIESHGGRLWAAPNAGPGATLHFTLPTRPNAHQAA